MTKIYFINGWGEPNATLNTRYSKQTPDCSGKWDDLVVTDNYDEADFYIVLESTAPRPPQDRTIFIKREPNFIKRVPHIPYKHVINFTESNGGVTYWLSKTYDELTALEYPTKGKKASCIVSSKHEHRRRYIDKLFNAEPEIDLYGRGHNKPYGGRYKGGLNYNGTCKFRGLVDYEYTIVMENSQQKNYWTEKLADAYLSWCMPIYWGCPNIAEWFPEGSYRLLDINEPNPEKAITEIINTPLTDQDIAALTEARNLILNDYNIWEMINKKIKEIRNEGSS